MASDAAVAPRDDEVATSVGQYVLGRIYLGEAVERVDTTGWQVKTLLRERLDPGEADSIWAAIQNEDASVTAAARSLARNRVVDVTGAAALLVLETERVEERPEGIPDE